MGNDALNRMNLSGDVDRPELAMARLMEIAARRTNGEL